jgi:hypothetical protein
MIKNVFEEHWDDYQLASVSYGIGGNKKFYDFLTTYGI